MQWTGILKKYKLHHVLFWVALYGLWYYFRYQDYAAGKAGIVTLVKVTELALMVYFTNYVLIPTFIYRRRYAWFGVIFVAMIATSSLLKLQLIIHIMGSTQSVFSNFKARVYDNVIPHFLLVSTGAAFKLLLDYARAQRQIADITKQKAEAELNFLKSQINPHFVFNALNTIYFLIDKKNTDARNVLHTFSEMLRYQLYELNGSEVSIEREVRYLHDYVHLQQLRQTNCTVVFNDGPNLAGFTLEPLLLIPFVENAFKHLSHHQHAPNEVHIGIELRQNKLLFTVANTTAGGHGSHHPPGIGLQNVQRRLELLYPGKHQLTLHPANGWYRVELAIDLHTAGHRSAATNLHATPATQNIHS